jgi:hypothetical protein
VKRIYALTLCILLFSAVTGIFAQTWTASVTNINNTSNTFKFSVYLKNTSATTFAFLGGQWAFTFNKNILNGGTLTGAIISSGIDSTFRPNSPTVNTTSTPGRLVFTAKLPANGGPCLPIGDSLKIFEAEFTNTVNFAVDTLKLAWRTTSPSPTQVSYYTSSVGNCAQNIGAGAILALTSPAVYGDPILPVELSSFTASSVRRDININWTTQTEVNSRSFEIERQTIGNNQSAEWKTIGSVSASGTSTSPKEYSFTDKNLNSGKFSYRLKMIDNDGTFKYSDAIETEIALPKDYAISQNYPNPFNPTTRIDYQLPFDSKVTLELYGITGEKIATLINSELSAGYYTADVNANALNLASGVYIYRMTAQNPNAQNFVQVKKLMLTK